MQRNLRFEHHNPSKQIEKNKKKTDKLWTLIFLEICRHFMGEDLESLSVRELQQLEQQLDAALRHVRSRKVNME